MLYLSEGLSDYSIQKLRNAGSKARIDVESIVSKRYEKFTTIKALKHQDNNLFDKVLFMLSPSTIEFLAKMKFSHTRDLIFIQYPWGDFNFIFQSLLKSFLKNHRVILLIHDIYSLREELPQKEVKQEIDLFNQAQAIIVHNSKMQAALIRNGLNTQCVQLNLFDYLTNKGIPKIHRELGNTIAIAGNLAKSPFLGELSKINGVYFNLYGNGFKDEWRENQNISYFGSYPSEVIPYKLEGSFGLVWDGQSIYTCEDNTVGRYTKINNPHKLSLYVAAGMPVIVWKQAAIADFVEDEEIGFTVGSLNEIPGILAKVSNDKYNDYLKNIKMLQSRVINGYYTTQALKKVMKLVELRV